MAFIVLLVAAVALIIVGGVVHAVQRRRLIGRIHDLGALPGTDGLPNDASIKTGELGRATASAQLRQDGFGHGGY